MVDFSYVSILHVFIITTYRGLNPELIAGLGFPPEMIADGETSIAAYLTIRLTEQERYLIAALVILSPVASKAITTADRHKIKTFRVSILH